MTFTSYQKPEIYVPCTVCNDHDFEVGHIQVHHRAGPWQCPCGAFVEIKRLNVTEFDVTDTGVRAEKRLVILESEGPVRLVLDVQHEPQHLTPEHLEYFYNEHTCPTNFLRNVVAVIDPKDGDDDPHGIFSFIGVGMWHDYEKYGLKGWPAVYQREDF